MSQLVALALQYAKEHDQEILDYAYAELKKLVEAKLEERKTAREAITKDLKDLATFEKGVDEALKG